MDIRLKRIYDEASPGDGTRILVDRLWPRGIRKEDARLDHWAKDVAPSAELRTQWHRDADGHAPEHFRAFAEAYRSELRCGDAKRAIEELVETARSASRLTLLFAAKDETVNHVVVLKDVLLELLE